MKILPLAAALCAILCWICGVTAGEMLVIHPDSKVQRLTATLKIGKPGEFKNPRINHIAAWFAFNPHRYTNDLLPAMTMADDGTVETKGRNLSVVRGTWVLGANLKPADKTREVRFAKALLLSGLPTAEFSPSSSVRNYFGQFSMVLRAICSGV